MKYKIINTDLLLNGILIPEGSTIELTSEQTEGITAYLQPLEENPVPNNVIPNLIRDPLSTQKTKKQLNIKKEK